MIKAAIVYFNAYSVCDLLLLLMNGVLASAIFLILLFAFSAPVPRRSPLNWYERAIRFWLVAVYGILAVRVCAGWYSTPVEPTHVAVNALVLGFAIMARGDVGVITEALRQTRKARRNVLSERKQM
ncbi:hypothetical protein IHE31_08615 [Mycetohabitans rhizoxinica]|jgi:hypothetical protein|uniref:Holin n=2 Tax=Mycetohabitans rhizoxinica TaxID=412963 RepID=E5AQ37_MYCRK|nr:MULTISPECIES: hypothetical protein [Mycetohabitans]MCF7695543.1 hypothetical protein [Mycetohabitans sp. B2]MCG1046817.1 hypothetical protein [Mycetohabitans sp. B6]CBW74719.1 unnamed protein product [Mycetohabitans rhizoxinica HKI 454]